MKKAVRKIKATFTGEFIGSFSDIVLQEYKAEMEAKQSENEQAIRDFFELYGDTTKELYNQFLFEQLSLFCETDPGWTEKAKRDRLCFFSSLRELINRIN